MNTTTSRSWQTIVLVLIALGLIGLALGGYLSPLSRLVVNPIISAQAWITSRYQAVQGILRASEDTAMLRQRNIELEAEVSRLQAQIIELQQQIADTEILSALVDFARANPFINIRLLRWLPQIPALFFNTLLSTVVLIMVYAAACGGYPARSSRFVYQG
jgi:hypothetical protein